ncbi:MAG: hypothetical protein LBS89_06730 [Zoogloeaceae bacterium]|jgi:hypothetical protein|nr:hypothetical protein [Zoogloeaceae bacterium]
MPIYPFIAGLVAGVVAVKVAKSGRLRAGLGDARQKLRASGLATQNNLRQAAVSGLDALASSSAHLRDKLNATQVGATPAPETKAATASAAVSATKPAAAKSASVRKGAPAAAAKTRAKAAPK